MKVRELFETFDYKNLSETEFEHLSAPDAKNVDDRYKVGKVAFDNKDGMGAVPNNQEIKYFGFAMTITPSEFLELAAQGYRGDAAAKIAEHIKDRIPIGAPFLQFRYNEKEFGQGEPLRVEVVGHEGRARMTAIRMVNGDTERIPVHVMPRGETRARHLDEKFFSALRKIGMVPEKTYKDPKHVNIGRIFWMGKTI